MFFCWFEFYIEIVYNKWVVKFLQFGYYSTVLVHVIIKAQKVIEYCYVLVKQVLFI